jgi:hypothetical protein
MKAKKITMTITIEVLHVDSIPALLADVSNRIQSEFPEGSLTASDGDHVEWKAEQKDVEF